MQNHYQILGLKKDAKQEDVKKAYFVMAKKYHPDAGDETEVKKFHEVAEAYKVLSDKEARKAYDTTLIASEAHESKSESKSSATTTEYVHQTSKRESYRDEELKEFHQNRFRKAVFRVVALSIIFGLLGMLLVLILSGILFLGFIAGVFIGIGLSMQQNFSLDSFFESKKKQRYLRFFLWGLLRLGMMYFVLLLLLSF